MPRYWDGQARVAYDLAPHETIELGGLVSSDRTTRNNPSTRTRRSRRAPTTGTDFERVYAPLREAHAGAAVIVVTPSFGTDSTSLVNAYGSTPTELTNDS